MNNKEKQKELEWNKDEISDKYEPSPLFVLESYLTLFIIYAYERFNSYLENKNQDYVVLKRFVSLLIFIILIYFVHFKKPFEKMINNGKDKDSEYKYFENFSTNKVIEKSENKEFVSYCRRCNNNIYKGDKFIKKSNRFSFFSRWYPLHNSLFCKNCVKYEIYERKRSFKEEILRTLDILTFIIPIKLLDKIFFKIKEEECNIRNQFFLNKVVFFGMYFFIVMIFFENYEYDFIE